VLQSARTSSILTGTWARHNWLSQASGIEALAQKAEACLGVASCPRHATSTQETDKPRFVSMLVYLNSSWPLDFGAETIFLDGATDAGILVRPRPGRVVLMDQDILHRVSAPSPIAGRPRYSLVWKLLQCSTAGSEMCLLRPQAGRPASFGSAHKLRIAQEKLTSILRQRNSNE
jgi:hypothetical protein